MTSLSCLMRLKCFVEIHPEAPAVSRHEEGGAEVPGRVLHVRQCQPGLCELAAGPRHPGAGEGDRLQSGAQAGIDSPREILLILLLPQDREGCGRDDPHGPPDGARLGREDHLRE